LGGAQTRVKLLVGWAPRSNREFKPTRALRKIATRGHQIEVSPMRFSKMLRCCGGGGQEDGGGSVDYVFGPSSLASAFRDKAPRGKLEAN
jgi:hypothetical protein